MTRHVIEVETFIKGTPEAVYTMLTDHPNLDSFRELSDSVLLREGDTTPHGKGAERQVVINMFGWRPMRFTEEIILAQIAEKKAKFVKASLALPSRHELGKINDMKAKLIEGKCKQ